MRHNICYNGGRNGKAREELTARLLDYGVNAFEKGELILKRRTGS